MKKIILLFFVVFIAVPPSLNIGTIQASSDQDGTTSNYIKAGLIATGLAAYGLWKYYTKPKKEDSSQNVPLQPTEILTNTNPPEKVEEKTAQEIFSEGILEGNEDLIMKGLNLGADPNTFAEDFPISYEKYIEDDLEKALTFHYRYIKPTGDELENLKKSLFIPSPTYQLIKNKTISDDAFERIIEAFLQNNNFDINNVFHCSSEQWRFSLNENYSLLDLLIHASLHSKNLSFKKRALFLMGNGGSLNFYNTEEGIISFFEDLFPGIFSSKGYENTYEEKFNLIDIALQNWSDEQLEIINNKEINSRKFIHIARTVASLKDERTLLERLITIFGVKKVMGGTIFPEEFEDDPEIKSDQPINTVDYIILYYPEELKDLSKIDPKIKSEQPINTVDFIILYSPEDIVRYVATIIDQINQIEPLFDPEMSLSHYAAISGDVNEVNRLQELGLLDVNALDSEGNTPLMEAIRYSNGDKNSLDVIKGLLELGSSLDATNTHGGTPLTLTKGLLFQEYLNTRLLDHFYKDPELNALFEERLNPLISDPIITDSLQILHNIKQGRSIKTITNLLETYKKPKHFGTSYKDTAKRFIKYYRIITNNDIQELKEDLEAQEKFFKENKENEQSYIENAKKEIKLLKKILNLLEEYSGPKES